MSALHTLIKEVPMQKFKTFQNIDEELNWEMFKLSGGNPYLVQEIVRERNAVREKEFRKTKDKEI